MGKIMLNRAYSLIEIKAVDEEKREITGIATTPATDNVGDIVMPDGAVYDLPIPLLWQHDKSQPIGQVIYAKITKQGIEIRAKLAKIASPSQLSARLEEAWESIKAGLVRGLSIGFRPIEYSLIDATGGYKFSKWRFLELSAVTIPANSEASITAVKSIDDEVRAALSHKAQVDAIKPKAGDTAKSTVKLTNKKENKMNINEQIKSYQNERAAKVAEMEALMKKSSDAGETLAEADAEQYDTLEAEVAQIEKHLKRLAVLEKSQKETAVAVDKGASFDAAATSRQGIRIVMPNKEKGIAFAQVVKCIGMARGNLMQAEQIADSRYKDDRRIGNVLKAAVAAGTTSAAAWAGNLVGDETSIFADFVDYLRPTTILGKFGQNGVPGLRNVPFRTALIGQTSGGSGYWVGEGKGKPLTKFDFSRTTLDPLKVANIAILTEEVLRDSSPAADAIVRDQLAAALRERLDTDFIDPTKTAVSNVSPASITNGISAATSSGTDAAAIRCDIGTLFKSFIDANNAPTSGVFIMPAVTAMRMSLMMNALGQPEFPGITMNGGTLNGMPVITSEFVPTATNGESYVFLINAQDIYLADLGDVNVDFSREASVEMSDAPTINATNGTGASMVSLWQTNCVGFRAERTINWARRRAAGVAVLDSVLWGSCVS